MASRKGIEGAANFATENPAEDINISISIYQYIFVFRVTLTWIKNKSN